MQKEWKDRCVKELLTLNESNQIPDDLALFGQKFLLCFFSPLKLFFITHCFLMWMKTENHEYYVLIGASSIPTVRNLTDVFPEIQFA